MLTTGKNPASLVLSWVVKYNIKESLTIRKSLCSFFPYTAFVPLRLDVQLDDIQSGVAGKQQKTLFSPLSVAGVCTIQEQWKPNRTNAAFGSVLLDWIRLICFVSCHWWVGYSTNVRERKERFFSFTCSVNGKKKKRRNIQDFFVFQATAHYTSNSSSHLGSESRSGRKPRRFLFCQFTFQFNQIHVFFFFLSIRVWFSSV